MVGKLQGKKALVTGAGTGIGREVALEFSRQGAAVMLHYAGSREGAETAAAECIAGGGRAFVCQADLGRPEECFRLVDCAADALGGLDILVNNAGVTETRSFLDVTPEDFDRLYHINIRGQFFCAQRGARHMLARGGGVVINVTSVHALAALPRHSVYAGTKGAICAWTRELAIELAPAIRVNALAPGWVEVPRHQADPHFDPHRAGLAVPMQRLGQPLDVAKACVYLASDDSAWMTGHVLVLDGGTTAWMSLRAGGRAEQRDER
jgi:NAD(P)-dependent dehydrogenase (short-subunit alcohol dehydrogenase family)